MNSITRRIAIAAAAVALAAGFAAAPASAGSAISAPVVSPASVEPGGDFTVSGVADCTQSETDLTLTINGLDLEQDFNGNSAWEVHFTAPDDAVPGDYPIVVVHSECSFPPAHVTIAAAATTTTTTMAATTTTAAAPAGPGAVNAEPAFTG
jgi:hypothetical protein